MPGRRLVAAGAGFALAFFTAAATGPAAGAGRDVGSGASTMQPACAASTAGPARVRCFALVDTSVRQGAQVAGKPNGFGAGDLEKAYNLPTKKGAGQLVAIVDAYDDPTAEADMARYRRAYGLPACTTKNGCFRKLNQRGGNNLPPVDGGWAVEISLDLDMVSAACPKCSIVLLEGDNPTIDDLGTAVDTAARMHAAVVTNSYGLDEFGGMRAYFDYYQHPRTAILASSGDYGFGPAQFPAVVPGAVAVGGTSLYRIDNRRGWVEQAWGGAGSGCSAYVAKPAYQHDSHCGMRTISDVSAVADPETGVAVYDSTPNPYGIPPGWLVVGGTSASSPLLAGVIGLAGNGHTFSTRHLYRHASSLYDAVGGSNGNCGGDYLCTGKRGYDAPTGLGTPNGIGAF